MRSKINIVLWILVVISSEMYGQIDKYQYKRELYGISDSWHSITLPDEVFKNLSSDFSDIRIYGVTKKNDTIEAPYLIKQNEPESTNKQVNFEIINRVTTHKGAFITFKIPLDQTINQIKLFFRQDNFDTAVTLEGSQNLKKWYTIVNNYRILSIKNELTSYDFTTVKFPSSKYQYYRVFIKGNKAPEISSAQITLKQVKEANYKEYSIQSIETKKQISKQY
ncbi:DUF3999 family protein [Aquimarina sp. 2201CG14-23]|uniref:DUF3999 family protein n=1 Tax=Aquimarina mycalae TaxID=3040073 RepID=UPI002477DEEB|nr:DUF3999 family protein [Aquimarina sp. 2201CG14-23]MDH7444362.1 DUF3999 family protein [Aquimarina sp. 2201CG14-23]